MIKPIFNPNAKNNMAEIIPILLARKCRVLYVVKDGKGHMEQAFRVAEEALKPGIPRVSFRTQPHWAFDLHNGSRLLICRMDNVASYLQYRLYPAIYVQAHKYESPELSHEEFVQLATDHLAESRDNLHQMLVDTGAIKADETLPSSLTKQAE